MTGRGKKEILRVVIPQSVASKKRILRPPPQSVIDFLKSCQCLSPKNDATTIEMFARSAVSVARATAAASHAFRRSLSGQAQQNKWQQLVRWVEKAPVPSGSP
jgi:hypothetical protein